MSKEKGSKKKCVCGHYINHLIEFHFLNQQVVQWNNRKIDTFNKLKKLISIKVGSDSHLPKKFVLFASLKAL